MATRTPRASTREILLEHAPWKPPHWELADATALRRVQAGTASPDEQKRAMAYIINTLAGAYDEPYRPGAEDGARDTVFALGRAFVGRQIVKLLKVDLTTARRNQE